MSVQLPQTSIRDILVSILERRKRALERGMRWNDNAADRDRLRSEQVDAKVMLDRFDAMQTKADSYMELVAVLRDIQIAAVDADLRASYHRTALEQIASKARAALTKVLP